MSKKFLEVEIVSAADALGIAADRLDSSKVEELFRALAQRFADGYRTGKPLWAELRDCRSRQDPDAWAKLTSICPPGPAILLIEGDAPCGFLLPSPSSLTKLLAETIAFEFYVTDSAASYLVAHNDHDVLVVCGLPGPRQRVEVDAEALEIPDGDNDLARRLHR